MNMRTEVRSDFKS